MTASIDAPNALRTVLGPKIGITSSCRWDTPDGQRVAKVGLIAGDTHAGRNIKETKKADGAIGQHPEGVIESVLDLALQQRVERAIEIIEVGQEVVGANARPRA